MIYLILLPSCSVGQDFYPAADFQSAFFGRAARVSKRL
jgi:hypothetical protein